VGGERFGPNTAQVEAFLERLTRLTPAQWEKIMEAAPGVGAIPDLEVKQAPDYFRAFEAATQIAKSEVFPASESAFYEAMRQAQLTADASAFPDTMRSDAASSAVTTDGENLSPEAEADAITRLMSTAYEEEGRRRVMNSCMMAAGALVVRNWLTRAAFERLYAPFAGAVAVKALS
jgi:hypothetical protein